MVFYLLLPHYQHSFAKFGLTWGVLTTFWGLEGVKIGNNGVQIPENRES